MKRYRKQLVAAGLAGATAVTLAVGPVGAQSEDGGDEPTSQQIDERRDERRAEFHAALAEELGIGVEELEAAVERVKAAEFEERLAEAVAEGRLTEEEAREMREAREDGTLHELMQERRVEHLRERLAGKVEAGEITQERADEILERAESGEFRGPRGRRGPGGPGVGPGPGGPGGPGVGPGPGGPGPGGDGAEAEGVSLEFA